MKTNGVVSSRDTRAGLRPRRLGAVGLFVLAGALLACGGKAATEDLEKLKVKTCACAGDAKCIEEAKQQARDWAAKHKNARGADQQKVQALMTELLTCDMAVGMELAKASE